MAGADAVFARASGAASRKSRVKVMISLLRGSLAEVYAKSYLRATSVGWVLLP